MKVGLIGLFSILFALYIGIVACSIVYFQSDSVVPLCPDGFDVKQADDLPYSYCFKPPLNIVVARYSYKNENVVKAMNYLTPVLLIFMGFTFGAIIYVARKQRHKLGSLLSSETDQ